MASAIDREEPTIEDEDSGYKVDKDSDQEKAFHYDWMYLAKMDPNAIIISESDLESRNMDRNHNWVNDAQKNYSAEDLSNAHVLLSQASTNIKEVSREMMKIMSTYKI